MMTQAFYTGVSGLKTSSSGIDIISDNLANVNTVGFRGNNYEFSSLFEDMIVTADSTVDSSIGLGSSVQATPMLKSSGTYLSSDRSTDLAIFGDGWFGIRAGDDTLYTRNGTFGFDRNSDLVTTDGNYVLGTMAGNISDGVLTNPMEETPLGDVSTQESLRFPSMLTYPAQPTTNVEFSGNIGTEDELRVMNSSLINPDGSTNALRLEFNLLQTQPESGRAWDVVATTQSADGEIIYDTQNGQLLFDESGALISSTLTSIDNNGTSVNIDLGNQYTGVVSLSNTPISSSVSRDGVESGELYGYDVNTNGDVMATFSNGKQSSVGKIAVYHFQNDQGLQRISGTDFAESNNSGRAMFYKDTNGNNVIGTTLSNYKLEGSNVDMTYGMTELIILQRSYDANSKSITTADEMMQKALEMDA
jgi:flagellar hook protein FlgE